MKRLPTLYKDQAQRLESLKPVQKYIVFPLIFLAIFLVFALVETHVSGPGSAPFPWRSQAFVWISLGASQAFRSERRRKHPKPRPPVTRYTRT